MVEAQPLPLQDWPGRGGQGKPRETGAAVAVPRDAYRDVPLLARPVWGHEVSAYFFFGGVSSGAFTIGSLALLAGGDRWLRLARTAHTVALLTLLPCPPLLISDLGKPERFHHMLRLFKPSSPMNLGAWALMVHGGMATLAGATTLAREGVLPDALAPLSLLPERLLAATGLPAALTLGGYTGVLLGTTSVPVWSASPLLGALFMASSLSTGLAATSLAGALAGGSAAEIERTLSSLGAQFGGAELALLGGYLASSRRHAKPLLAGRHGLLIAGAAGTVGAGVTLDLLAARAPSGGRALKLLGGVAKLLGGALLRTAVVGAGAASAADREGTLAAAAPSRRAPGWLPSALRGGGLPGRSSQR